MKLIVGLGNIGEKYDKTRHNLGFMVVDRFLQDCKSAKETAWEEKTKFKSLVAECVWKPKHGEEEKLILAKPTTNMNGSGVAVSLLATFYKIDMSDIWIVHDELDLPVGSMKIRNGGSAAGHHGIESILEKLGTEKFWRFRMGIGMKKNHGEIGGHEIRNVDEFVLGPFAHAEVGKVRELIKRGSDALQEALENGMDTAMHRFNTK
jgi:PTH1 family peptidyl-tRNA hydrolase